MQTLSTTCRCGATYGVASFDSVRLCPRCVDALRQLAVGQFDIDTLAITYRLTPEQVATIRDYRTRLSFS